MVIKAHNKIEKVDANYTPLSPVTFLSKAAKIFPERTSIIYESQEFTWRETYLRCKKLASSLSKQFRNGDVIGFLASNTPELYEAHFGVPINNAASSLLLCAAVSNHSFCSNECSILFR